VINEDIKTLQSIAHRFGETLEKTDPKTKLFLRVVDDTVSIAPSSFWQRLRHPVQFRFSRCAQRVETLLKTTFESATKGSLSLSEKEQSELILFATWYDQKVTSFQKQQQHKSVLRKFLDWIKGPTPIALSPLEILSSNRVISNIIKEKKTPHEKIEAAIHSLFSTPPTISSQKLPPERTPTTPAPKQPSLPEHTRSQSSPHKTPSPPSIEPTTAEGHTPPPPSLSSGQSSDKEPTPHVKTPARRSSSQEVTAALTPPTLDFKALESSMKGQVVQIKDIAKRKLPKALSALQTERTYIHQIDEKTVLKFRNIDGEVEVYIKKFLGKGGYKHVDKLISLAGSRFREHPVVAYAKIHTEKREKKGVAETQQALHDEAEKSHGIPFGLEMWTVNYIKAEKSSEIKAILSEICDKGSLRDLVWSKTPRDPEELRTLAIQIATALDYMHTQKKLCHMDIKPENILLKGTPLEVRLSDFGLTTKIGDSRRPGGTWHYAAPEQISKQRGGLITADAPMDIWQLGIVFVELFKGPANNHFRELSPKDSKSPAERKLAHDKTLRELSQDTPINSLIKRMISLNPEDRPTAAEVCNELKMMKGKIPPPIVRRRR
jgi:serine/threonine protein kinase